MRHFFILGSNPVLSTAEIMAVLEGRQFTATEMYKQALIADAASDAVLDAGAMMNVLGGTVKIGTIISGPIPASAQALAGLMMPYLEEKSRRIEKPVTYGVSVYALESDKPSGRAAAAFQKFRNVGMETKRQLKEAGISARFVRPQAGSSLSSVAVTKNKMIEGGAEFVVLTKGADMLVGTTDLVQPFEEFSEADYGRPGRDMVQGMLPPKLARIMINLVNVSAAKTDITLLDPFCGSGTIPTEALRMGFRNVIGSDKNAAAVDSTRKNIAWLKSRGLIKHNVGEIVTAFVADARNLSPKIKDGSIDAIVSEPYLGPSLRGTEKRGELQKTLGELSKLYYEALSSWRPLLKPGAPVVLALPVYIHGLEKHGIGVSDFASLGYAPEALLPSAILTRLGAHETKNRGLLYGRNDQRVWREIVRLRVA